MFTPIFTPKLSVSPSYTNCIEIAFTKFDTPEIFRPKSDMERVKGALRSSGTIALSAILREFSEFLHFANTQRFLLTMQY